MCFTDWFMYVCMYLCIYVPMYLCIYLSMYLCIYVSMYLCIYVCMHAGTHARTYVLYVLIDLFFTYIIYIIIYRVIRLVCVCIYTYHIISYHMILYIYHMWRSDYDRIFICFVTCRTSSALLRPLRPRHWRHWRSHSECSLDPVSFAQSRRMQGAKMDQDFFMCFSWFFHEIPWTILTTQLSSKWTVSRKPAVVIFFGVGSCALEMQRLICQGGQFPFSLLFLFGWA